MRYKRFTGIVTSLCLAGALVATLRNYGYKKYLLLPPALSRDIERSIYSGDGELSAQDAANARLRQLGQTPLVDPTNPPTDPWTRDLLLRLDRIRANCGELCAIDSEQALDKYNVGPHDATAVTLPRQLQVPVDCDAIVTDEDVDVGDPSIPRQPPAQLLPFYTLNGLIPFQSDKWHNQTYVGNDALQPKWTVETFKPIMDKINKNFGTSRPIATYGRQPNDFAEDLQQHVDFKRKRVLVIGTEHPWLEGLALWLGAAHVVTVEYGKITSTHPNVTTLLPSEFREQYKAGTLGLFDIVLSFSSLEHPGLGRYGDALNPWGDVIAVARAHCVTKPGGYLGLGMPSDNRLDAVLFNECRSYGPVRWPLVSANWRQIDGANQPKLARRPGSKRHQPLIFQKPPMNQSEASN